MAAEQPWSVDEQSWTAAEQHWMAVDQAWSVADQPQTATEQPRAAAEQLPGRQLNNLLGLIFEEIKIKKNIIVKKNIYIILVAT